LYTPITPIQQQVTSRLKLALVPKVPPSPERNQIKTGTPSGIKSDRIQRRNKSIIPNRFDQLNAESLPTDTTIDRDTRKQKRFSIRPEVISPEVKETISKFRRESKRLSNGLNTMAKEDLQKGLDLDATVTGSNDTRRKSLIPAANQEEIKRDRQVALDALRRSTVNTIIQVDEESLDLNGDGVSFSLSSRIKRRQTLVQQESNRIVKSSIVPAIQHEERRRKFQDKSKLLNKISVMQELEDTGADIKAEKKSAASSHQSLSTTSNDGTQTTVIYSANVIEDNSTKKQTKTVSATSGTFKKSNPKSESHAFKDVSPGKYLITVYN
jgi:hypothetical protein